MIEQPEALRLALWHKAMADEPKRNEGKRRLHRETEEELRRQHARIAELEAQLATTRAETTDLVLLDGELQESKRTVEYFKSQLSTLRASTIEECAKVCDEKGATKFSAAYALSANDCAAAIRGMK